MSEFRVASRYAKSLISFSEEEGIIEEVHNDMKMFREICKQNRNFVLMLQNPVISIDRKSSVLKALFDGKFHQSTMAFFSIITRKHREKLLPLISEEFHNQYNELNKIGMAKVSTVFALDEDLRESFKELVRSLSGDKEVELAEEVDESLIGGFLLKLDHKQVDESLRGKLKELSLKFS